MNGFKQRYSFLVNAEVDSMGGVVDIGVGIGTKPSPRRVAIEKAQAELRLEYDVLEERRRELEFLEKGGDPLDFKFGHVEPVSVQSTSHRDQQLEQVLISEAKGSFALTASPHGDSFESSGRLGVTTACELNSADNFDGENNLFESETKSNDHGRDSTFILEHSSQLDGSHKVKESENSTICRPKKGQAYRRRYRSRPNREGLRSSSAGLSSRGGPGPPSPNHQGKHSTPIISRNQLELKSDGTLAPPMPTNSRSGESPEHKLDVSTCKDKQDELQTGVKDEEAAVAISDSEPYLAAGKMNTSCVDVESHPCSDAEKTEDNAGYLQLNDSGKMNGDGKCIQTEGLLSNTVQTRKAFDSYSSCSQTTLSLNGNGNNDSESNAKLKDGNSNGNFKEHELSHGERPCSKDENVLINAINSSFPYKEEQNSKSHCGNGYENKVQDEVDKGISPPRDEAKGLSNVVEQNENNRTETKSEKQGGLHEDSIPIMESSCSLRLPSSIGPYSHELRKTDLSVATHVLQPLSCGEGQQNSVDKAHENIVLEEARSIEAKHKRIAELSVGSLPREYHQNSCWDFVLEEMAWLANDFAQERLWKMTAAAQISHQASFTYRIRLEKVNKCWMQKSVAHTLAKAVIEFWNSAQFVENVDNSQSEKSIHAARSGEVEVADCTVGDPDEVKSHEQKLQPCGWKQDLPVHRYAVRFLQFNCSTAPPCVKVEGSGIPDIGSDIDLPDVLWPDQLTEENLFYVVPFGAMETYRESIESCLTETERTDNATTKGDTTMFDVAAEFGYQMNEYEEDEGENISYLLGAFNTGRPPKKKQKTINSCRAYESGHDFGYNCFENRNGTPQSFLMGKRPFNSLHVEPIPTKRMRTASRPRVVGPYYAEHARVAPTLSKADGSSGDTSCQEDLGTFDGGSVVSRGSEADSVMDFEKQSIFDSTEISAKSKKKKKIKHQGSLHDARWQLVSAMQTDQNNHVRKRLDSYQLESNGNSGLFGKNTKKQKMMKQPLDSSFNSALPTSGSVASPVASQMSNMSSQSKVIKLIGGRDRGRKAKAFKVSAGQPGPGSPWSLFEDQALVVLVHDMGLNWELVSDAINSTTMQLKCIFRKPLECKERHRILMDRSSSDGVDSADDSGSSQPYPSTLQGIPKGSARQLFQQLQEPIVEDTIKSHFEKIILIGQKLDLQKKQDLRPIASVHGSHVVALSQVIPNNVNGGILTPLDLCDAASNQDLSSPCYQGPHARGLASSNQGAVPTLHPPNGLNSSHQGVQGSLRMSIGNNLAASPSQFNSPRSLSHRPGLLSVDEKQSIHQYNHLVAGRNIQPGSFSPSGGGRIQPSGNGVGLMTGMTQSMAVPRPGHSGITSSVLNSGSMIPTNMNMHSEAASSHGNFMLRSCDALQMVQTGQSSDHQRQILPEMPTQGTQAAASPPVQTYAGYHPQKHPMPQQRSHMHLSGSNSSATSEPQVMFHVRERQIQQQRLLQQRQQQQKHQRQHVQTPVQQPPMSSSVQSTSPIQPQASSRPVPASLPPMTHLLSQPQPHAHGRSAQNVASGKQWQQSGRQHPQQRQLSQFQQQAKALKGTGKSINITMQPNLPMDPSLPNGISASVGAQVTEKMEQSVNSGSSGNVMQQSKSLSTPQTSNHFHNKKSFTNSTTTMTKQVKQIPSHSDGNNHNQKTTLTSAPSSSVSSGPIGSIVNTSSLANEPLPSGSQDLSHRQLSGNNSVGSQWQPSLLNPKLLQKPSQQPPKQLEQSSQMVQQQLPQPQI